MSQLIVGLGLIVCAGSKGHGDAAVLKRGVADDGLKMPVLARALQAATLAEFKDNQPNAVFFKGKPT